MQRSDQIRSRGKISHKCVCVWTLSRSPLGSVFPDYLTGFGKGENGKKGKKGRGKKGKRKSRNGKGRGVPIQAPSSHG